MKRGWTAENSAKIERYIASLGRQGRKVAIFDWDNTSIWNDVGDATVLHLVRGDLIRLPRGGWGATSRWLTNEAVEELEALCPSSESAVKSANAECAAAILGIYHRGLTPRGFAAWKPLPAELRDTLKPAYAWGASLLAGRSVAEIESIAADVIDAALAAPFASTLSLGGHDYDLSLRVNEEMMALAARLRVVRVFALRYGFVPEKVIGVRNAMLDGAWGPDGLPLAGRGANEIMTYRKGKRAWINHLVFGLEDEPSLTEKPSPISFGAGDSDTDLHFLLDADFCVLIDRQAPEASAAARRHPEKFAVQPPFFDPKR